MGVMRQVVIAFALLGAFGMEQASARFLVPHRAVYDLTLDRASEKSGITSVVGRMVYEFKGTPCEGYTTNFRYVTRISSDDASQLMDQQTSTFEDGAGKTFKFETKSFVDRNLDTEVKGTATHGPDGISVKLDKPNKTDLKVRQAWFPTQHLVELLDRAEQGRNFYETNLFDASDKADRAMTTSVVVGKRREVTADDPEYRALGGLEHDRYWPVTIAYFDTGGDKSSAMQPVYSISLKLLDNGITRDLHMDYGEYALKGRLVNLVLLDQHAGKCSQ
jgi:hypothetical protein